MIKTGNYGKLGWFITISRFDENGAKRIRHLAPLFSRTRLAVLAKQGGEYTAAT